LQSVQDAAGEQGLAQDEDYRFKARECEARAQFVRDPNIRRMWEALARQWHELADELERILGGRP
jgi:hypothetical protein